MIIQKGGALDTDTNPQTNQQGRGQNDVIIVQESSHFNKKFQVSQDTYSLKFDINDNNFVDFNTQLDKLFDKVYNFIKSKLKMIRKSQSCIFSSRLTKTNINTFHYIQ